MPKRICEQSQLVRATFAGFNVALPIHQRPQLLFPIKGPTDQGPIPKPHPDRCSHTHVILSGPQHLGNGCAVVSHDLCDPEVSAPPMHSHQPHKDPTQPLRTTPSCTHLSHPTLTDLSSSQSPSILGTGTPWSRSAFMTRYSRSTACAEGRIFPGCNTGVRGCECVGE